jgi:FkbM family methyltransferase
MSVSEEPIGHVDADEAGAARNQRCPQLRQRSTLQSCAHDDVLARLIPRLLALAPARPVEALRRHRRVAKGVDRVVSLVLRGVHGKPVAIARGPAAGLLLRLPPSSSIWVSGKVEERVQRVVADLLVPEDVFFDIGANLGFFTVLAARLVGPAGRVIAFEPHPDNAERLRRNVELNGFANVTIVRKVVSDTSGRQLLDAASTATASVTTSAGASSEAIDVPAISIDDFLASQPTLAPKLVKIDVEGHEEETLRGMATTLTLHRPLIVCELHAAAPRIASLLADAGYALDVLDGERLEPGVHVLARPVAAGSSS